MVMASGSTEKVVSAVAAVRRCCAGSTWYVEPTIYIGYKVYKLLEYIRFVVEAMK
jgi:hypothetical protein